MLPLDSWAKIIAAMKKDLALSQETTEHIKRDKESKENVTKNKRI